MSKILSSAVAVAAISMAGSAVAADLIIEQPIEMIPVAESGDWYVSLFGGGVWTSTIEADYNDYTDGYDIETDVGYALGITVGTKVFDYLRIEGELSGTVNSGELYSEYFDSYDDADIAAVYLLGNAWFDLETGSGFTPYIGGGLGAAYVKADLYDGDWELDGFGFAYQLGAGVKVDIADNIALDLGYRYKAVPGITIEDTDGDDNQLEFDLSSHVVQAGLTFKF